MNKVCNKETNEQNAWQKYRVPARFEPGTPGENANTITTELKRILSNSVVWYCIQIRIKPCMKEEGIPVR